MLDLSTINTLAYFLPSSVTKKKVFMPQTRTPGNNKGGSITVLLTSCLTGLNKSVLQIKTKFVSCHTDDSKPVKQEVYGTVILLPSVFPASTIRNCNLKMLTRIAFKYFSDLSSAYKRKYFNENFGI
jgi:hypothetical protein